jgi:hypothetical protein
MREPPSLDEFDRLVGGAGHRRDEHASIEAVWRLVDGADPRAAALLRAATYAEWARAELERSEERLPGIEQRARHTAAARAALRVVLGTVVQANYESSIPSVVVPFRVARTLAPHTSRPFLRDDGAPGSWRPGSWEEPFGDDVPVHLLLYNMHGALDNVTEVSIQTARSEFSAHIGFSAHIRLHREEAAELPRERARAAAMRAAVARFELEVRHLGAFWRRAPALALRAAAAAAAS